MSTQLRMRNLAVPNGHPASWVAVTTLADGVTCISCGAISATRIAGLRVNEMDAPYVLESLRLRPADDDRHDELADGMRAEAGRCALTIRDAMVRARTIEAVDGWEGVCGALIEHTDQGTLHRPADDAISAHVLSVTCPSTGRRYVMLVPIKHATVAAARAWVNRGVADFDVET